MLNGQLTGENAYCCYTITLLLTLPKSRYLTVFYSVTESGLFGKYLISIVLTMCDIVSTCETPCLPFGYLFVVSFVIDSKIKFLL